MAEVVRAGVVDEGEEVSDVASADGARGPTTRERRLSDDLSSSRFRSS